MNRSRLEAFSDGVLAIVVTIMVLELKAPQGFHIDELKQVAPIFLSYILSFLYVSIYWINHHHLLNAAKKVDGKILWANLHWLFWMSLIPFFTSWLGKSPWAGEPCALYGVILLICAIAYNILQRQVIKMAVENSKLVRSIGNDFKGKFSILSYAVASWISFSLQ